MEQARTFEAIARLGSFAKAGAALKKGNSAIAHALASLEDALGLTLLDRSGYRTQLTPVGERVREHCEKLLAAERDLATFCETMRAGESPFLHLVFDGLLPIEPILSAVDHVARVSPATRVALTSEYLGEVEARAVREEANVMITVVPLENPSGRGVALAPLESLLVARGDHPLAKVRRKLTANDLSEHRFLTVRGSDPRLAMSTASVNDAASFKLSDFPTKRSALLAGMGYGWMPEHLVARDIAKGRLKVLRWDEAGDGRPGRHLFRPMLHVRGPKRGPTVHAFVDALTRSQG